MLPPVNPLHSPLHSQALCDWVRARTADRWAEHTGVPLCGSISATMGCAELATAGDNSVLDVHCHR